MEAESITFTSINDEQDSLYVLDVDDPRPICIFDVVTIRNHLLPFLKKVTEIVQPRGIQIFDLNWHRMSISNPNSRMARTASIVPKMLSLSDDSSVNYPLAMMIRNTGCHGVDEEESSESDIEDDMSIMDVQHGECSSYFGTATPVPHNTIQPMVQHKDESEYFGQATSVPLEMRSQPTSAPDLFYIAIKAKCQQSDTMLRLYKGRDQEILETRIEIMTMHHGETTILHYENLVSCLEDNPHWKRLLAVQVVPFLVQFVKSVAEMYYSNSATSSTESMDWSDVSQEVGGLADDMCVVDREPLSAAVKVAEAQEADSGFTSNFNSTSSVQIIAREDERLTNDAEVEHFFFSEVDHE